LWVGYTVIHDCSHRMDWKILIRVRHSEGRDLS
jgi:hypothetical protein